MSKVLLLILGLLGWVGTLPGSAVAQDESFSFDATDAFDWTLDSVSGRTAEAAVSGDVMIGDINCNDIAYEIADAVMFSNCFMSGLDALGDHVEKSMAAADVNQDGSFLTVADLVYLIRIIVGDALPYDQIQAVSARVSVGNGILNVNRPMGAAFIVVAGDVTPTLLANGMEMISMFNGKNTNILIYSLEGNSFNGDFLRVDGYIGRMEFGDFAGRPVRLMRVPSGWILHQNYPNPFNLSTTIKFDVPVRGLKWELSIFNVTGQLVREFSGAAHSFETVVWDAENMAAGVYFYQMKAGGNILTRKMTLMK